MKKQKMLLIALVGVIVFGSAIYGVIQSQNLKGNQIPKNVSVGLVKKMSLEATIFTTGRVVAADERSVYSQAQTGKVEQIFVKEGQSVKKDFLLASLSTSDLDDQIKNSRIQLSIAKETLTQIKTGGKVNFDLALKTAQKSVADATKTLSDKVALYNSGAISLAEKDVAQTTLERAQTELESTKRSYDNYGKESQIKIQTLSVQAAQNTLNQLIKTRDKLQVKAPIDGVIYKMNVKVGDQISMTLPMFNLATTSKLLVESSISEFDIDQISLGQEAIIKGDGFEEVYKGKISYISPVAESVMTGQSAETVVKIKVAIEAERTKFKPNFSANLEIRTATVQNALTIPYEAIYTTKEGLKKVFVVADNKLFEKIIKTGVEGDLVIEALGEGLKEGDQVLLNPTEDNKDGDSVKIVKGAGGQK